MTRLTRRGFTTGAIALVGGACGGEIGTRDERSGPAPEEPPPPDFDISESATETPAQPPDPNLAFSPVGPNDAPPAIVWSWTTEEQIEELRRDKILFTRESSPTLGRGHLFDILDARAKNGDETAARLVGIELAKGRFGWSNPWATVRGAAPGESYGRELLAITMKPDTWYARVQTSRNEITFVDAAGAPVDRKTALASFERVGGILFHHDVEVWPFNCWTGTRGGGLIYREIYLGNETRLASVAHRTKDIADVLEANIRELSALRAWSASGGNLGPVLHWSCAAKDAWQSAGASSIGRYLASLAFATAPYAPDVATLDALVAELVATRFTPDPFTLP